MRTTFTPLGHPFWRAAPLAFAISFTLAACGSSSDGPGAGLGDGGGGGINNEADTLATESIVRDGADIAGGAATTLSTLSQAFSQQDLPVDDAITSGTGDILVSTGEAIDSSGDGLRDGVGSINTNDNAFGTTLGGVARTVAKTGEVVENGGKTLPALQTLPVFMQVEENSGALTMIGSSLSDAGVKISENAEGLAVEFEDENSQFGQASQQLTLAIRPVLVNVEGSLQRTGDAIVIGPMIAQGFDQAGGAVVNAGIQLGARSLILAGPAQSVSSTGRLVQDTGRLFSTGESSDNPLGDTGLSADAVLVPISDATGIPLDGETIPLNALLGQAGFGGGIPGSESLFAVLGGDTGAPLDAITGGTSGLPTDQLAGLTGGEGADPVTGLVGGLTGGGNESDDNPLTGLLESLTDGLGNGNQ